MEATPVERDNLKQLGRALADAGYSREALRAAQVFSSAPVAGQFELAMARTSTPTRFNSLLRLFVVGATITPAQAKDALEPCDLTALVRTGFLLQEDAGIRSVGAITPFGGMWIVHDFPVVPSDAPRRPDCVLGIGGMTTLLANLSVRRGEELVLDLGSGQGFQSMLAGGHARRVIATDLNERALRLAAFGAAMNDVTNVEFRRGSLFEPLRDMEGQFDLVVCNPPFVIAPPHNLIGLSGGTRGDELCEAVVRQTPGFLSEGGFATVLANWPHESEADWHVRPSEWVAGSGCDAWIIRVRTQDTRAYAAQWVDESEEIGGMGTAPPMAQWLDFYAKSGVSRISLGAVVLRRRAGTNWIAHELGTLEPPPPPASDQILRIFANRTFLSGLRSPGELLDARPALTPAHELVDQRRMQGVRWQISKSVLHQTDGLDFPIGVDAALTGVLEALDGKRSARAALAAFAKSTLRDASSLQTQCIPVIRRMLELGHLTIQPRS